MNVSALVFTAGSYTNARRIVFALTQAKTVIVEITSPFSDNILARLTA